MRKGLYITGILVLGLVIGFIIKKTLEFAGANVFQPGSIVSIYLSGIGIAFALVFGIIFYFSVRKK